jgi:DNA adenine methylase
MRFLRYPGGKTKIINFLKDFLPNKNEIKGNYCEPFVGGGSVYLHINPKRAVLSDLNKELIDLYKGIRNYPHKVWEIFSSFPKGKRTYYRIRDTEFFKSPIFYRAARTLYLNRTCFKGMWRHGENGNFNVGYGGEDRRWAISKENLIELSKIFKKANLVVSDFEDILNNTKDGDFIFLDPPYKPGENELRESHYTYGKFTFEDQIRLSKSLIKLSKKKDVKWMMTNSNHKDIKKLYKDFIIKKIPKGTSSKIGITINNPSEILIKNF